MTHRLITTLSSPAGRHSAKVYQDPKTAGFLSVFYFDGVAHRYADAFTETESEALEETTLSLRVADEMHADLLARAASAQA